MRGRVLPGFIFGLLFGIVAVGAAMVYLGPQLMINERVSPFGLDETVQKITDNAKAGGWVVSSVIPIDESVRAHGGGEVPPTRLVNICQAEYATQLLKSDDTRFLSVMMPCTIAVYEKSDGKTYVATMNAGIIGRMFRGVVAEVMSGPVAQDQAKFTDFLQ